MPQNTVIDIPIGITFDLPKVNSELEKIQGALLSKPLRFNIKAQGSMETIMGDLQGFFHQVKQGADNIETLSANYATLQNVQTGVIQNVPTKAFAEFRDETGKVIKITRDYKEQVDALLASGKYKQLGTEVAMEKIGVATRKTEKEVRQVASTLDRSANAADKFLSKSSNMSGKAVQDARRLAEAIKLEKAEFDKFFEARQWNRAGQSADKIKKLTKEFNDAEAATKRGANAIQAWGDRLANAIKQTIAYSLSLGALYKAQRLLNDAIRYTIDLNTEMVKIQVLQVEGAKTEEEINSLARAYNELGIQMGASTLEIAKGSVEWLRQGRTIQETTELMKSSMMLAKLGNMASADATNYLTSVTNAFKIEVEDTSNVVDKLIAVDNIAATSAGELATALRYTSESASLAGVTLDQLISYIGIVSTVTRQNAEMIGQAFKTMFARMTQIEGGGVDEEGMTISKVEKALAELDIQIKETDGSWRGMGIVLEEIAEKWDTLTDRQKAATAAAIAGVRQREPFFVLMENMNKALEYQAEETTAAGLAWDRYGIYLDSIEAKQGQLRARTEELMSSFVDSEMIAGAYDLANGILEVVNNLGGIPTILAAILPLITALVSQSIITGIRTLATAIAGTATALIGVEIAAGPVGWALLALSAIISGITFITQSHNRALEEQKQRVQNATYAVEGYIDAVDSLPRTLSNAKDILEEINKISEGGVSQQDSERLKELYSELYKIIPTLDWTVKEGNPFLKVLPTVEELKSAIIDLQITTLTAGDSISLYTQNQEKLFKEHERAAEFASMIEKGLTDIFNSYDGTVEESNAAVDKFYGNLLEYVNADDFELLPEELQTFAQDLQKLFTDVSSDLDYVRIADDIRNGIIKANSIALSEEDLKNKTAYEFALLWGKAIESGSDKWTPFLKEAGYKAGEEFGQTFYSTAKSYIEEVGSVTGRPDSRTGGTGVYERRLEVQTRLTEQYNSFIDIIEGVSNAERSLNEVLDDGESTILDRLSAVQDYLEIMNPLAEGLGIATRSIIDFIDEDNNINTDALDDYSNSLYDAVLESDALVDASEEVKNAIRDAINEIRYAGEEINQTVTYGRETYELTADQFQTYAQMAGQALWDLYGKGKEAITITANDGTQIVLYSADQVATAIAQKYTTFVDFISQMSAVAAEDASKLASFIAELLGLLVGESPFLPTIPTFGGGGGGGAGGGGKDPEVERIENEIDDLRDTKEDLQEELKDFREDIKEQKKELRENLDDELDKIKKRKNDLKEEKETYDDYIDAQKESLRLLKDEKDFRDSLAEKNKDLARIQAELALLEGDNSEEAQRKRIELTEDASGIEEDIRKETEDRKYDLQIEGLDRAKTAFDDAIEDQLDGLDKLEEKKRKDYENEITRLEDLQTRFEKDIEIRIGLIDDEIDRLNDMKKALQDIAGGGGGGGGGRGWEGVTDAATRFEKRVDEIIANLSPKIKDLADELDLSADRMRELASMFLNQKGNIEDATRALETYIKKLSLLPSPIVTDKGKSLRGHSGGIIPGDLEEHHAGNFAGNLRSNEVFAKLLKGEYVATEHQMDNFLKNILPKIATNIEYGKKDKVQSIGDMNIDIDIHVSGSLDKKVVPDISQEVAKSINRALEQRGIRRTANSFSS